MFTPCVISQTFKKALGASAAFGKWREQRRSARAPHSANGGNSGARRERRCMNKF